MVWFSVIYWQRSLLSIYKLNYHIYCCPLPTCMWSEIGSGFVNREAHLHQEFPGILPRDVFQARFMTCSFPFCMKHIFMDKQGSLAELQGNLSLAMNRSFI